MNNQIVYRMFYMFQERGFTCLRFNFRGVGRSQGYFDHGVGELADAAAALDWIQTLHPDSRGVWIAGFSFGAWIGMQLLMRRPEVEGFISIAPQPNLYDFSFLAPCPSSGLIINGDEDKVAPMEAVQGLVDKLKTQKGIVIDHALIKGANHFFEAQGRRADRDLRQLSRHAARGDRVRVVGGRLRRGDRDRRRFQLPRRRSACPWR